MKKSLLTCAVALGSLAPLLPAAAQGVYSSLYLFNSKSGIHPAGSLIEGANGVLYGTTSSKAAGFGSVYSLTPPTKGGSWTLGVLYAFQGGKDGSAPEGALVADPSGALYGTTTTGGAAKKWGTVFKLTPPANGSKNWTETVLYSFLGEADGGTPRAGLLLGSGGVLYGTTAAGLGTVFELTPPAKGKTAWTQTVLHTFQGPDGASPTAALIADAAGALYGTTEDGGNAGGYGTVFQMVPPEKGQNQWTENVLYSFAGNADGSFPSSNVTFDQSGNLFGTVEETTNNQDGAVYELSPPSGRVAAWTKSTLYTASQSFVAAGVIFGNEGDLYGVTEIGGTGGCGIVFQLTPPSGGQGAWTENDVYDFQCGDQAYGTMTSLLLSQSGVLVGTSEFGGKKEKGAAYQVTP